MEKYFRTVVSGMCLASMPAVASAVVVTINPVEDSDVTSASVNSNNGTSGQFYMASAGQIGFSGNMAFLKFANTYSSTAVLSSAVLKVFNYQIFGGGGTLITAYDVSDNSWTETGITWSNRPAYGSVLDSQAATFGTYTSLNVTAYIQSQISGASSYMSVALTPGGAVPNFASNTWINLYSREGTSPPILELNFTSIPEPSTYAAIFGCLSLGVVGFRRYRLSA